MKALYFLLPLLLTLAGCASAPKATVELAEITDQQVIELQKSHTKFVKLYYGKLRDDVNRFIDEKWTPAFLTRAVNNPEFRADLDAAYVTSTISPNDLNVLWRGKALAEPQKTALLRGVKQAVDAETSKLGLILLDWSQAAQLQINKKRQEMLMPIDAQERFILSEIDSAYADLQRSQATIKAYLASVVELKSQQDQATAKIVALEKVEATMAKLIETNEKLSKVLASEQADKAATQFLELMEKAN